MVGRPPARLSAGRPFSEKIGVANIAKHEKELLHYATTLLEQIKGLKIIGQSNDKAAVITFVINGYHANDLGMLLDLSGVCVRTGHHCAQPLLKRFNVTSTVRASFGIYNTKNDVDTLILGLNKAKKMLK